MTDSDIATNQAVGTAGTGAAAPVPGQGPRLLILGSYPPPFGGISTHLAGLVPHLIERGFEITLLSPGEQPGDEFAPGLRVRRITKRRSANAALMLRHIGPVTRNLVRSRFYTTEFLEAEAIRIASEPLVEGSSLICVYHLIPWAYAGAQLSRQFGIPLVTVNFGEYYTEPEFFRRHRRQIKFIESQATEMLSVSSHCGATLAHLDIQREVRVVRLGIDVTRFTPGSAASTTTIRKRFAIAENDLVVLFLGRMIPDMGLHTLLSSIPKFADKAVTIVAGAQGELTEKVKELAALQPDRVFVAIDVPSEELPLYYQAADVVVAPSRDTRSCCGLAIKEAMAVGRPIVASSIGGIPEVVVDGETGLLVPPGDADRLAEAIGLLLGDTGMRSRMGLAGRRRALEIFDMRATHVAMEGIFRSAAQSAQGGSAR